MNKKSLMVSSLIVSAVILAGCFGTAKKDKNPDEFTIAACNDYVQLMRCVADKSEANSIEAHSVIDQAVATWKSLSENELNVSCSWALETAKTYASAYEDMWCSVPNYTSNTDTSLDNDMIIETADPSIIEAISGEVDSSTGTTVIVDQDNEDSDIDAQNIEAVMNDISTGTAQ